MPKYYNETPAVLEDALGFAAEIVTEKAEHPDMTERWRAWRSAGNWLALAEQPVLAEVFFDAADAIALPVVGQGMRRTAQEAHA